VKWLIKQIRRGEGGFTLVELLVVIAVVGTCAGLIVLSIGNWLGEGEVEIANLELYNIQTAVVTMMAEAGRSDVVETSGVTHGGSITIGDVAYPLSDYVQGPIRGTYDINNFGIITGTDYSDDDITWDAANHCWKESS
jgi:prepilin-type N-terminal cleavage/methylation domain-containing protein